MPQDKDDSVKSALDDILNIRDRPREGRGGLAPEAGRGDAPRQGRGGAEGARRGGASQARGGAAAHRRRRSAAARGVAEAAPPAARGAARQQDVDAKARLAEEEMRLKHEQQLAVLDAQKKKIPLWIWIMIGVGRRRRRRQRRTISTTTNQTAQAEKGGGRGEGRSGPHRQREAFWPPSGEAPGLLQAELEENRPRAGAGRPEESRSSWTRSRRASSDSGRLGRPPGGAAPGEGGEAGRSPRRPTPSRRGEGAMDRAPALPHRSRRPASASTRARRSRSGFMCPGDPRC